MGKGLKMAQDGIADQPPMPAKDVHDAQNKIVAMVKEMVNRSYETSLDEGLLFERRGFHSLFATEDQKEGMAAFLEKREAQFRDK